MRRFCLTRNDVDPPLMELANLAKPDAYLAQTQSLLEQKIKLLKKMNTVRINKTVLDTISVIDFKKSRWANVFLLKNSSRRMAIPTVDPAWSFQTVGQKHN